ncbi:hypothetical protein GIB67_026496 [Kingdonia uniflora]|uniref:Uncharacterized protein n=1 Tax=Kingdonia uniflora TaxID=39325 RepID=A0A7J7P745_9MAGN|nr:hypothetical protein GIB67_026496 [Kingdonia uniflora]
MAEIETKKKKTRKRKRSINVKVEILKQKPETSLPLIGYFPSGFDPQSKTRTVSNSDEDEEEEEIETRVRVFKSKLENHANRFQLVVSPSGTKVEFVGTSYSGEAATPKLCTYSLGVLDKATNLLRIVPIASDKIFRLEPRIAGKEHIEEEDGDLTADGKAQKKAQIIEQLTNQYGTKTSINRRKKAESLDEKENPDAKKDLEIKIKGIEINKEALQSTSAYSARNIPPHNPTATTPEEAYPINKIILEGELSHLLDIMEHVESGEELSPNAYPSFISNRISWLQEIQVSSSLVFPLHRILKNLYVPPLAEVRVSTSAIVSTTSPDLTATTGVKEIGEIRSPWKGVRKNCERDIVGFTLVLVVVDPTIVVAVVGCAVAGDSPITAGVATDVAVNAGPAVTGTSNSAANAITADVAVDEVVSVIVAIVEPLIDSPPSQNESLVGVFGGRSWIDLFCKIIEEGTINLGWPFLSSSMNDSSINVASLALCCQGRGGALGGGHGHWQGGAGR